MIFRVLFYPAFFSFSTTLTPRKFREPLNPKTDIAKNLIYSNHVKTKLDEDKTIRLTFDGNSDEPVIANIVEECGILVSILFADTKVIDGKIYGQLVFKLPKKTRDITKLRKYLDLHHIQYEEVIK